MRLTILIAALITIGCGSPLAPPPIATPINLSIHVAGNRSQQPMAGIPVGIQLASSWRPTEAKITNKAGIAGPWVIEHGHAITTIYVQDRAVTVCCIPATEGQMSVSIPD